ncbi:hypothetical protein B566_EDAN015813, partial [Ephemera danica]
MKEKNKSVLARLRQKKPQGRPKRGTRRQESSSSESGSQSDSDKTRKKKNIRGGKKDPSSVISNGVSHNSDSDFEDPKPKSKPTGRQAKNKKKSESEESEENSEDEEEYVPKKSAKQKGKGRAKGKEDSYIDSSAFVDKRKSSKTVKKTKTTEDSESDDESSEVEIIKFSRGKTSKPSVQKKEKKQESSDSEDKPTAKKQGKKEDSEDSDSSSEEVQKSSKSQQKTSEKSKIGEGTRNVDRAPSPSVSRHVTDWMAKCSKSDEDKTEVAVAVPVGDTEVDQEMEEMESDGSSKQGGVDSDETGVKWLEQLITDASTFSQNFNQRIENVQQSFSENMDKEAIQSTCKTLYNVAKKSMAFFERHKANISNDYGEWKEKEQRRVSKKIQEKQRKSMSKVMQTPSKDDSLTLPNSEAAYHSDSSKDATAGQDIASKPMDDSAEVSSDGETNARKVLKFADPSPPKPKPKIGPKSKIQRKSSSDSSADEQDQSPVESAEKSEGKNVSFTVEANDQVNQDTTADEEKIQSSLAVLQEVVADVDKSLTQDTIEKLSKTLDAGKASRMSVDPFGDDDEDEDGVEDQSIHERSTVCEETPDLDNASETTRQKILEADTEPETTLPPVGSQETHFEKDEELGETTQVDPANEQILEETTQEINPNLLKVDKTKLERCSVATTQCESSDEYLDASEVVCESGDTSKLNVSVVSAYTTSGDELPVPVKPKSKTDTAKPDAYISILESSSSSDEDKGTTKHRKEPKSNTSPNVTENFEPSGLDEKDSKSKKKSDDDNAQSIAVDSPEQKTKEVVSEVKFSPTKRKIGPKSKMKYRNTEDSDSEVTKMASTEEKDCENENTDFTDSVANAFSENEKADEILEVIEKDSSKSEDEAMSKSANNFEPDAYNTLPANSSEEEPVEQTDDKKTTLSKPKKKHTSSERDHYNALLMDSSSEGESKSDVTKKSSKKKIGPKSRTRRNWLDRVPSPDIYSACNLNEFEDNKQLTTKCYVALGRRCKDKEAALDKQIQNLMNLSNLEKKRENAGEHLEQLEHALKADRPRNEQDQLLDSILVSSDSGPSSDELSGGDGNEKKEKKMKKSTPKAAAVKTEKQEEADSEDEAEKERKKRKSAWRNAKELKNPLSDSDESVISDKDGSILQKMKDREKNEIEKSGSDEKL